MSEQVINDHDLLVQEAEDQSEAAPEDNTDHDYSLVRDRERRKIKPP